jgi:ribosome maturation factor RimP
MAVRSGKQTTTGAHRRNAAPAHRDAAAEAERLREFLRPTVEQHSLILEDVEVRIIGGHRTLHVVVDLPEGGPEGLSLDLISEVSQSVSNALDNDPGDDGRPYNLEVSSPGVSRPLTQPRHWRKNVGRLVAVRLLDGEELQGRLTDATDSSVTLTPLVAVRKGTKPKFGEDREIPYDRIRKGTVQVEFAHADTEDAGGDND